jgi:hypothetical protein
VPDGGANAGVVQWQHITGYRKCPACVGGVRTKPKQQNKVRRFDSGPPHTQIPVRGNALARRCAPPEKGVAGGKPPAARAKIHTFTAVKFGPRPPRRGFFNSRKTKSNMNNFVSYETALRLRAAGFPQPKPEAGQMWYDPYSTAHVVTDVDTAHSGDDVAPERCVYLAPITEQVDYTEVLDTEDFTAGWRFAPGPAEILRELGPDYQCGVQGTYYWCGRMPSQYASVEENMAEACAAQWLSIHEKKQ